MPHRHMLKQILICVTPDEEVRLAEIQRQLGARNPNPNRKISLTRTATITLRKGMAAMIEDAAD